MCVYKKKLAHALSCAYFELWMYLGILESTQEARVALGVTFTLLSRSPNFPRASITRYTHVKHEPILNCFARNLSFVRSRLKNEVKFTPFVLKAALVYLLFHLERIICSITLKERDNQYICAICYGSGASLYLFHLKRMIFSVTLKK